MILTGLVRVLAKAPLRDLLLYTYPKTVGLSGLDNEPIIESTVGFTPVGAYSTLAWPYENLTDEMGYSEFITFLPDGSYSKHVFNLHDVSGNQDGDAGQLLVVIGDRYAIYTEFPPIGFISDLESTEYTYGIYDLTTHEWLGTYGPYDIGIEFGLVD